MKYSIGIALVGLGLSPALHAQETASMHDIRKSADAGPVTHRFYFVTDAGKEGVFEYDAADRSSADDSVMVVVGANGERYRRRMDGGQLNVKWFGASGEGAQDDWYAIQKGIDYILSHDHAGRTLYFPPGSYRISRPLIIARFTGAAYKQASISLVGPAPSRTISAGYAELLPTFNNSFAIGIQMGKGVLIRDLMITGRFVFPNTLNEIQVDTLAFSEWTDGSSRDNRFSPYSGIVIDPFSDSTVYEHSADMYPGLHAWYARGMDRGGSTSVEVVGCSIRNFVVGVMITPSNQQNGELIDVIDCDISGSKVAYSMGQAQSKECHVLRLKCWQPVHTVFDNRTYGFRHGDGAAIPMVDGINIAGYVKQLCNIYAASFSGTFRNVYAEGLFRLGFVDGAATVSFEDCQIDFSTQDAGLPYPDFFILGGSTTFRNCMLRIYPGVPGARLILPGSNNRYEGGLMNNPPIAFNIEGNPNYSYPTFQNVTMYYSGGVLGNSDRGTLNAVHRIEGRNGNYDDPVYDGNTYTFADRDNGVDVFYKLAYHDNYERVVRLSGTPVLHADKRNWTGYFKLNAAREANLLRPGDFILTSGLHYQDQFAGFTAPAYPVGIIRRISHDTVILVNLGAGLRDNMPLSLWADYYVYEHAPTTGDLAPGSNSMTKVQGRFPEIGERLDIPVLPAGTFVTAVNANAGTITFSNANTSGRSLKDYTFMNGYPAIEIYSDRDLPALQRAGKTLIGDADFFRFDAGENDGYDRNFPLNRNYSDRYRIFNTNFRGDTSVHRLSYAPAPVRAGQ